LVPVLETIAIRTVVNAPTIQPLNARKSWDVIDQTRREQHLARAQRRAIGALNGELVPRWSYFFDRAPLQRYGRVQLEFKPPLLQQVTRGRTFVAKQAVYGS
jgi:hypothetical protein